LSYRPPLWTQPGLTASKHLNQSSQSRPPRRHATKCWPFLLAAYLFPHLLLSTSISSRAHGRCCSAYVKLLQDALRIDICNIGYWGEWSPLVIVLWAALCTFLVYMIVQKGRIGRKRGRFGKRHYSHLLRMWACSFALHWVSVTVASVIDSSSWESHVINAFLVSTLFQFVIARCLVPLMQLADSTLNPESAYEASHLNIRCYWLVISLSSIATTGKP